MRKLPGSIVLSFSGWEGMKWHAVKMYIYNRQDLRFNWRKTLKQLRPDIRKYLAIPEGTYVHMENTKVHS